MTAIAAAPASAHVPQRPGRRRSGWVRAVAFGLAAALVLLGIAVFNHTSAIPLDPANDGPDGGAALAAVLSDHGIDVRTVHTPKDVDTSGGTVLVTRASVLTGDELHALADRADGRADRLVLVGATTDQLREFGLRTASTPAGAGTTDAGECAVDWASGLTITRGDRTYKSFDSADTGAQVCFTDASGNGSLLVAPATPDESELVAIGANRAMSNQYLAHEDNAAFAVRALGSTSRLVWLSPTLATNPGGSEGTPVFPAWVGPAILLALATLVLLAAWRGRRFGRLVTEPLPVLVKASDTTRSRGELYRRARDLPRTSAVLRTATVGRVSRSLAVHRSAPPDTVVAAVAGRTGRSPGEVHQLLYGDPPPTEAALTTLTDQLRELERQVRS